MLKIICKTYCQTKKPFYICTNELLIKKKRVMGNEFINGNVNPLNLKKSEMEKQLKKQKLIQALKDERLLFVKRGADPTEHDIAIDYLINGTTSSNPDKWELLEACMNDYDTMLSDYDC